MFENRRDAGNQLARKLRTYRGSKPLVLALPRGGVIVAEPIAKSLQGDLDVLLVKKLGAPGAPELALGAVTEDGECVINETVRMYSGVDESYIESSRQALLDEMAAQRKLYRSVRKRVPPAGRTVILVDDGLATGATMVAGVQALNKQSPGKLIVAVPVAADESARRIEAMSEVDEFVCLDIPPDFAGVGQFYRDFGQVPDDIVAAVLEDFSE